MRKLPFIPLSVEKAQALSRHFKGFGEIAEKMFPSTEFNLRQSESPFEAREWLGIAFFAAVLYAVMLFGVVFAVVFAAVKTAPLAAELGLLVGAVVGSAVMLYFSLYPKVAVRKKERSIESNVPPVLRHMLVQVRSGVTVFNAMNAVAKGGYGKLSEEFGAAVKDINTGHSEVEALERLAVNNPLLSFRRIIWQLVNSMKSGSDIGSILKEMVDNITTDQKTAIKKYGSELNPISLFYMMIVVIFPTLGIVFLLVLFSFVGAAFSVELILVGILALLAVIQIMFVGLIKSKRPVGL